MSDENIQIITNFIEIPKIFFSDLTGKPFDKCIQCEKDLLEEGTLYMIEKAFSQTLPHRIRNTIFEYAMCIDCWEKMSKELSQESMWNLKNYFDKNVDFEKRKKQLDKSGDYNNVGDWLSKCIVKETPIEEQKEFQIACQCDGKYMVFHYLPYMISGEAMEEVQELISSKTLDELDNFKHKLTAPDPDLAELFDSRKVLVI